MKRAWVAPQMRQHLLEFILNWQTKTKTPRSQLLKWLGISSSTYHHWKRQKQSSHRHNGQVPKAHWLLPWERERIVAFAKERPGEGYRRLTYQMIDANVVAASPSSVYRVLKKEGLLQRWPTQKTQKGSGFQQPKAPHHHWHTDMAYLNICGTFYYLCSIIDGYSRYVVHQEIRPQMKEMDVEIIVQRALEKHPGVKPRLITDNGSQFVARDLKVYLREQGLQHVRTSPYYPQSNGKIERWHKTLKTECIRRKTPLSLEEARQIVGQFVDEYNTRRLHSAIGYITPRDKLKGKADQIFGDRSQKLALARERRKHAYQAKAS